MLDYSLFFKVVVSPYIALFWRRSCETSTLHRNPIFGDEAGVSFDALSIDTLHTMYLGVWQRCIMWIFWHVLLYNCFEVVGTSPDRFQGGVIKLRAMLFKWYHDLPRAHKERVTQLEDLTVKMLGSRSRPKLKVKAMECKGLSNCAVFLLETSIGKIGVTGHRLLIAMRAPVGSFNWPSCISASFVFVA